MKINSKRNGSLWGAAVILGCELAIAVCSLGLLAGRADAMVPVPGGNYAPTNQPLDSWSFHDSVGWTDDASNAPISFTNISFSNLGDGAALVLNTNVPAWLNYYIYEPGTGSTNLIVNGPGSLTFWYAPAAWSSTNMGGNGPGQWTQLINVGELTTNSSIGYWGLSVDPAGENLWFAAQDGAGNSYSLSTPISWTTNYFHFITLTYCSTNLAIYLDGELATNDSSGLNLWPGSAVLATGVYFGSDPEGLSSAQGSFNSVASYSYPLDANDIQTLYDWNSTVYKINPLNVAMWIQSAPSNPSTNYSIYDIITGAGNLQQVGSVTAITSTNVWITNVVASVFGTGTNNMRLQFTIQGGFDGVPYDTFVNSVLDFSSNTNLAWSWQGQGFHGNTYVITNLPNTICFLILGTPQDSDFDGLTDAYERLVSKTNPYNADTSGDGISDSDKILAGLNPFGSYPQWMLDSDSDGLPDAYESANSTAFNLSATTAENPPVLPSYTKNPVQ
jgi:hypothetical protein